VIKPDQFLINVSYYNRTKLNGSGLNVNKMKAKMSKIITNQRYRGELDISAPGNKNVLLDSDSDVTTNSKNNFNFNSIIYFLF